ncbi:MAG: hypothetical protein IJF92_05645 [Bacilli bacterium]|nr:hypothetical protein [Bacilli bacterium]
MATGATFDFGKAKQTMAEIDSLKTKLQNTLNAADDLIKANVNNDNVWNSESSSSFMADWNKFSSNSFPKYIAEFNVTQKNLGLALDTFYHVENS